MGDYKLKIGVDEFQQEVEGTEEWGQTILRDFNDKLLRVRGDYNFKGWQNLYSLIYNNIIANGVCTAQTGKVFYRGSVAEAYSELWRGEIKPQDAEFDLLKESVDTQILDNSWSAQFNNSKDQEVFLRTNLSKNETAITPTEYADCGFFNPVDASYYGDTRRCFRVYDVFRFLIDYYSNGSITFTSDFYNTGDGEQYYITTGRELRLYDGGINPEISFNTLFKEMDKKHNLWIIVEGTFDAPVLRIEQEAYALDESIALTIENPESIVMKTDLNQLYTIISIGADTTGYDPDNNASYPNRYYESWLSETYNTVGDCEFENNTLNLLSDYRIDSNSIEQALKGNDDFDDDIFIVEIDTATLNAFQFTDQSTQDNSDLDGFYNYNLTNSQVVNNWFKSLPTVIAKELSQDYYVYADSYTVSGASGTFEPLIYTNDTTPPASDTFNIYTTPTEGGANVGLFIAPVTGYYNFSGIAYVSNVTASRIIRHRVRVWQDNSLLGPGVPNSVYVSVYYGPVYTGSTSYALDIDASVYLEAGWVARAEVFINLTDTIDVNSSYMKVTGPPKDIVDGTNEPLTYLYDIQRFQLPQADFESLKTNIEKQIRFTDTKTGRSWQVWPKEMSYDYERQIVTTGEFIGRAPTNPLCWVLDGQFGLAFWDDFCYWIDGKGWFDCSASYLSNSDFQGNPVTDWTLTQGTQIAENQFQTPVIGNVILTQSVTLSAGSYVLSYDVTVDNASPWLVSAALTGSTGLGNLFSSSTNLNESGEVPFTYTGGTNTLTITGDDGPPPPQTIFTFNLIKIC